MPSLPTLSAEQLVKPRYFGLRISLIYLAVFVPLGVHLPYFPVWLEAKGFDAEQIAIILSAPMFLRVVSTPFITAMADQAKRPRQCADPDGRGRADALGRVFS